MSIRIYTDGSCLGNPGPGGWAALVKGEKHIYKISGGELHTTNNRMELTAAIWGIKTAMAKFPEDKEYAVYSDSSWVVKTMTDGWKRKMNLDLWDELIPLLKGRKVSWHWVKGHSGHPENEDCDQRAQKEAYKFQKAARKR